MRRAPEAQLIFEHRERLGLSIREAARRAQISEGSWRRTESPGDKNRTAGTIARMALAVGVAPAALSLAGRPDAAEILGRLTEPRSLSAPELEDRLQRTEAALRDALAVIEGRANGHPRAS